MDIEVNGGIKSVLVKYNTRLRIAHENDIYDVINNAHLEKGHGGRDILEKKIQETHANISRDQLMTFLSACEICAKKQSRVKKSVVVKPIVSN